MSPSPPPITTTLTATTTIITTTTAVTYATTKVNKKVWDALYRKVQSNSVITNSAGPAKFVRYNRKAFLLGKSTLKLKNVI